MSYMKQARIHGVDDLRLDDVPVPTIGPDDVLVKILACGICGSDIGYVAKGGLIGPSSEPLPLGHELSGILAEVGANVRDLTVGMRVIVNPDDNLIGSGGPGAGFAPYLAVRKARKGVNILVVPAHLRSDIAALTEPLSVALHGVNRAQVQPGHKVVVFGAGAIGLGIVIGLKRRGVTDIVVVDVVPRRLELARQLGARITINPKTQNLGEVLGDAHGTSSMFGWPMVNTDVFIDAAGAAEPLQQAIGLARNGTRFVIVALHKHPVPIDLIQVMAKELVITGSIAYPTDEFAEVLEMLSQGEVDVSPLISHRFAFADFIEAFTVAKDSATALKVIVEYAE